MIPSFLPSFSLYKPLQFADKGDHDQWFTLEPPDAQPLPGASTDSARALASGGAERSKSPRPGTEGDVIIMCCYVCNLSSCGAVGGSGRDLTKTIEKKESHEKKGHARTPSGSGAATLVHGTSSTALQEVRSGIVNGNLEIIIHLMNFQQGEEKKPERRGHTRTPSKTGLDKIFGGGGDKEDVCEVDEIFYACLFY